MQKSLTDEQLAMRVSVNTILWNVVLTAFKLFAGVVSHSTAMLSDAVHSASDVLSTFVVMAGVKMAGKQSDADHPYGHERLECVAAILLAIMLAVTGFGIGTASLQKIAAGDYSRLSTPGGLALWAAVVSIVVKEAMYWYTRAAANKVHSGSLMADAWHHRSDALSSIGSFVGILGARLGFPVLDSVAGLVICLFILKVSVDIFRDSMNKMTDRACDAATVDALHRLAAAQVDVLEVDLIKTRLFGDRIYVDIEITADGAIDLRRAHQIAQTLHDAVEVEFPLVKHCMVHVNPTTMEVGQPLAK